MAGIQFDAVECLVKEKHQAYLEMRQQQQKEEQARKQQAMLENQKKKEQQDKELEEKRKRAEELFSKRLEERKRVQLEIMKKEMQEREELLKQEENRKLQMLENIRRKEELRKQMQVESYRKRLQEENRRAEETEKKRTEKANERKKALEEWHKNKTGRGSEPPAIYNIRGQSLSREAALMGQAQNQLIYAPQAARKKKHRRLSKMDLTDAHEFSSSVVLEVTEQLKGKRDPYTTIEPLNDPAIEAAREKVNLSHLSLTVAVRSPRNKTKQH